MPEARILHRDLRDLPERQVNAYVARVLAARGFDPDRPFRWQSCPRERCVYYWQDAPAEAAGREREEMRRAYREMMADPDIRAARDELERRVRAAVQAALQSATDRIIAEHYPGMTPPTVRLDPPGARVEPLNVEVGGLDFDRAHNELRREIMDGILGAFHVRPPAPEEPLTTGELRGLLGGGDVPAATFNQEGGYRLGPTEN